MSHDGPDDARARAARDFNRRMRRETVLTWIGRGLIATAAVVILQHLVAHAGYHPVPLSMGNQDLLIGYPTGALLAITGAVIWGRHPHR